MAGRVRGAPALTGPAFGFGWVFFSFFPPYLEPYCTADLIRTVFAVPLLGPAGAVDAEGRSLQGIRRVIQRGSRLSRLSKATEVRCRWRCIPGKLGH